MSQMWVTTKKPIALDSPDHIHPFGTARDNYSSPEFNARLYEIYSRDELLVIDLGCAGGGFVKSLVDDGVTAIGIEGSNYSLVNRRAEWATIPDRLFTADITEPFQVFKGLYPAKFTVITAWEVMEHIQVERLAAVMQNVNQHLLVDGVFFASITTVSGPGSDGFELHQTIEPEAWWTEYFSGLGWKRMDKLERFFGDRLVRHGETSFFVALRRN